MSDPKAVDVPVAVAQPDKLLTSTRAMAEKWITAITGLTGLLGLLGLSGIALGRETLSDTTGVLQGLLVTFFALAVVASAVALVACTGAAYGFPPVPTRFFGGKWAERLAGWEADADRARQSVKSLWLAMLAGVVALGFTLAAIRDCLLVTADARLRRSADRLDYVVDPIELESRR